MVTKNIQKKSKQYEFDLILGDSARGPGPMGELTWAEGSRYNQFNCRPSRDAGSIPGSSPPVL